MPESPRDCPTSAHQVDSHLAFDFGLDLRLHAGSARPTLAGDRVGARPDRARARDRALRSTTRPSCWPRPAPLAGADAASRTSEEQGLSGARNSGVAACGGEVVAFLDDDAFAAPDWLERLAEAYRDPDGARRRRRRAARLGRGQAGLVPARVRLGRRLHPLGDAARARKRCATWSAPTCRFRREALVEVGGFRHELGRVGTIPAGCEETDLCIRIGKRWPRGDRSSTTRPPRSITSSRPRRGTGRLLHLALPRRGALEGGARRARRQRLGTRSRALLRAPHPAAGRPARHRRGAPRRPQRPLSGGDDRRRPRHHDRRLPLRRTRAPPPGSPPRARRRAAAAAGERRGAAGPDGDAAQPALPGRRRAPRDGSQPADRRRRARRSRCSAPSPAAPPCRRRRATG